MAILGLSRDTLLDLTVNFIPIGILAVLEVMFFIFNPWEWDPVYVFWMHFLTLFPLTLLLILTYVSGRVVQRDERLEDEGIADEDPQSAHGD